ncbi:MAG: alpha/beta hydrolase family protein [Thiobacillaceae bacterium]
MATLAFVLLGGCATQHPAPKLDEAKVKQFAGQGYLTDDRYSAATTRATWVTDTGMMDVEITLPTKPGFFPLVVYLPALGEGRHAGDAWQSAWAAGGYAVISIQPLREDARAWSSPKALAGDFPVLARERYSGTVMASRIEALRGALKELIVRQGRKEAPLDRVDLSHVAIAGYDLGAYTAMVIAGEKIQGPGAPVLPIPISAAIALSPYSDFSGMPFDERYRGIHLPVLSVTTDNDTDPLGLVTSPSVRKAPFEYMPAGDKYLVTLFDLPHRTLAGGEMQQESEEGSHPHDNGAAGDTSPQNEGHSGGHRRHGSTGGSEGQGRSAAPGGMQPSPTSLAIGVTVVQGTTTAFLDAYLKHDPIAREWLDKDAFRWIKDRGEIKEK